MKNHELMTVLAKSDPDEDVHVALDLSHPDSVSFHSIREAHASGVGGVELVVYEAYNLLPGSSPRETRRNEYQAVLDEGAREVMPGLAALPSEHLGDYVACMYAYIEATDDDAAFGRMVRLRDMFAAQGYFSGQGLVHLRDADGS